MKNDSRLSIVPKKLKELQQLIDSLEWEGQEVPQNLYNEQASLVKLNNDGVLYVPNF